MRVCVRVRALKGIRINARMKNCSQQPLVWKECSLRLAPLPRDVPRAGQLLTPRGGFVPAPPGGHPSCLVARSRRSGPQRAPGQLRTQHVDRRVQISSVITNLLLRLSHTF